MMHNGMQDPWKMLQHVEVSVAAAGAASAALLLLLAGLLVGSCRGGRIGRRGGGLLCTCSLQEALW